MEEQYLLLADMREYKMIKMMMMMMDKTKKTAVDEIHVF